MKKISLILSALVIAAVGAIAFFTRPKETQKQYTFLQGATLVESVTKDPRYGGGQRDVYEVKGELNEVLERVRREVAPGSKTKKLGDTAISHYPDGDNTIIVGAGKALPWSDFAKSLASATDQETKEILQKGAGFRAAPGIVTIIIDRPYAELAAKALTGLSRKLSPPKPKPNTNVKMKLMRMGNQVEAEITITNTGTDTQDEFTIEKLRVGGVTPSGTPIKVTHLKPGASHVANLKLPNLVVKGPTVPYRMEVRSTYKGSGLSESMGGETPAP